MLQRYLSVINLTSWSTEDKNQGQIIGAILERLRTLLEVLSQASKPLSPATLCPWIQALLHLIIVHKMPSGSSPSNSSIASPQHQPHPPPKPNTSHQASLIWILRSYLLHPELRPFQGTTEYALDVAAVLSDDLPDEARTQLCKMESQRPSGDARIAWLLGRTDKGNDMAWLGLVTPVHGTNQTGSSTGTPAAAAQPMQHQHQARGGLLGQPAGYPHSPMPQQFQPQHALHQQQGFWQARHQPYQQPFAYQQRPLHSSFPSLPGQSGGSVGFAVGGAAPTPGASPASSSVTSAAAAPASSSQHNSGGLEYTKPIPFHLRRWEILPDASGGGATGGPGGASSAGNDTSLSLTLFGGRRVVR